MELFMKLVIESLLARKWNDLIINSLKKRAGPF